MTDQKNAAGVPAGLAAAAQEILNALDHCDEGCTNGGLGPGWCNGHGEEAGTRLHAARNSLAAMLAAAPQPEAEPGDMAVRLLRRALASDDEALVTALGASWVDQAKAVCLAAPAPAEG